MLNAACAHPHHVNAVAEIKCFVNIVRYKQKGDVALFDQLEYKVLRLHPPECIDGAEGLIQLPRDCTQPILVLTSLKAL